MKCIFGESVTFKDASVIFHMYRRNVVDLSHLVVWLYNFCDVFDFLLP